MTPFRSSSKLCPSAIVPIGEDTVVVHTRDYLDGSPRVPFRRTGVADYADMLGAFAGMPRSLKEHQP